MATLTWLTGFEHGVLSVNGAGLFDTIAGTVAVQGAVKRTGSYALQANPSPAAASYVRKVLASSIMVVSLYVRFAQWPSTESVVCQAETTGDSMYIAINPTTHKLYPRIASTSGSEEGDALLLDTWYRIDARFDPTANPWKVDWQLDGTPMTQFTNAQAAATMYALWVGPAWSATNNVFYDDVRVSATTDNYPIGPGQVDALLPTADGTHNAGTNTMEDNDGNDIGVVTAYDHVNQLPMSESTLYVKQSAADATKYAEIQFADVGNYTDYHGVIGQLAYMSATATTNKGGCVVRRSDGTEITIWGNATTPADYSESSMFYKSAIVTPPAGGWTQTEINALRARMGYSTDVNPVPYWENLLLEVAHNAVAAGGGGGVPKQQMHLARQRL